MDLELMEPIDEQPVTMHQTIGNKVLNELTIGELNSFKRLLPHCHLETNLLVEEPYTKVPVPLDVKRVARVLMKSKTNAKKLLDKLCNTSIPILCETGIDEIEGTYYVFNPYVVTRREGHRQELYSHFISKDITNILMAEAVFE